MESFPAACHKDDAEVNLVQSTSGVELSNANVPNPSPAGLIPTYPKLRWKPRHKDVAMDKNSQKPLGSGNNASGNHGDQEGDKRTPHSRPDAQASQDTSKTRGQWRNGSLLSWRVRRDRDENAHAKALVFANPNNICYANAVIHMLYFANAQDGQLTGLGELNGLLTMATRLDRATNLVRDSAWSSIWQGWTRPTRQHDAAEFLQHLCQKIESVALRGGWEARRHDMGAYEVTDEQYTCPHVRLQLSRPFHVQDAMDNWRAQATMHAFTHLPHTLILQVGRFIQTDRGVKKSRQTLHLQRRLKVPAFSDHAGNITLVDYSLYGGVMRIGQVVTAGHYQAFLLPR